MFKALLHCNLSRNVLATLWRDKLHETFHSITYPATAKIVARQVARKVELNSTFGNGSCNLSRNDFGRCRVCYTVKCFVQLVPPQCRQNIARQVARNISQCNSAFSQISNFNPLGFDNERILGHQKLINYWVTKAQMSPHILCKISNFQSVITQRLSCKLRLKFKR